MSVYVLSGGRWFAYSGMPAYRCLDLAEEITGQPAEEKTEAEYIAANPPPKEI